MEFRCRLGTPSGEIIEGVYIAHSETALRRELEEKGLHVLSLRVRGGFSGVSLGRRSNKIPRHEFLVFNQELATLLKAGMPLVQSIDILRVRLANPVFKAVLDDVHEKVRAGTSLSDAFAAHGELFPGVYTASLMAGERSGNLETVLRRFVAYTKVIDTVRSKTLSALIYPVILIALALVLVGIIVIKVVPTFSDFYSTFGAELPLSTRIIVERLQHRAQPGAGHRRGGGGRRAGVLHLDQATGAEGPFRSRGAQPAGDRRRACTSSPPRSWPGPSARCSEAAFRW